MCVCEVGCVLAMGTGGVCGLLLIGIFFWGGGRSCLSTLRLRLRLGIVLGVYSNLNVFGACLIHIS